MDTEYGNYWAGTEVTDPGAPLDGDTSVDVCIVGGGYTGLWAAHFLKKDAPALDVRIVEADHVGAGASGMNAGFVQMTGGKVLRRMMWYYGKAKTAGAYKAISRSILELGRFCKQNQVDAELENNGIIQVVTDSKQLARLALQVTRAEKAGMGTAFELLDQRGARERIDSPEVLGGLKVSGSLVNPWKLAQGIARVVRAQGVKIYERTRVSGVEKVGDRWRVHTPSGVIDAGQVVMATNAWQNDFPELDRRQMPVWNHLLVSEPLTDAQLGRVNWPGREGVANSLSFSTAARLTADNRVMWAGGMWFYQPERDTDPRHVRNDEAYRLLRESFARFFPAWKDVRFSHQNGGLISWSHSFIPQFGRTDTGLVYGHGYTGSGIAPAHTGGKIIRDLVLGRTTEYTELAFVTVTQPKFLPGVWGDRGADYFVWRQKVGDRLPLVLPYPAAIFPKRFFASRVRRPAAEQA